MQRVDSHQVLDEGGDIGAEFGGAFAAPHRGAHEERRFLRRVVVPVGLHPFGDRRMRLDQVRPDECLHQTGRSARFDVLADVTPRHRVEGAAHVDVTVRADLGS